MKKVFACLGIILSMIVCVEVSAFDISNISIEHNIKSEGTFTANLELNIFDDFDSKFSYFVKFVNETSKPTDIPDNKNSVETSNSDITKWKSIGLRTDYKSGVIYIEDDWYMLEGYEKAFLLKCNSTSCEVSDDFIKITKKDLPKLGKRYRYNLADGTKQSTIWLNPLFPYHGSNGTHKISIKVGRITDNKLLYSLYKNEVNSLSDLIKYAKNNNGTTLSYLDTEFGSPKDITGINVVDGAYYYIMINYDNQNGLYRDLSDISVAMGKSIYLTSDVTYNFTDENISVSDADKDGSVSDEDIKNPSTADLNIYAIVIALITCVALIFVSKKKLNKNK